MRIFSIDFGTMTGWATFETDADPQRECGVWDLRARGKDFDSRLDTYARQITRKLRTFKPHVVSFEKIWVGRKKAKAGGVVAINAYEQLHAYEVLLLRIIWVFEQDMSLDVTRRPLSPSEIKKSALTWASKKADGKMRAASSKDDLWPALKVRYPDMSIPDENAAVALAQVDLLLAEEKGSGSPWQSSLILPSRRWRTRGRRRV
jgi:hypothetical protein